MKKIIMTVVLCVITLNTTTAQFDAAMFVSDVFLLDNYIKRQNKDVNFKDTKTYKGTPYNNPSFLLGNIYKEGKLLADNLAIRYNAVADEMEVKQILNSDDENARVLAKSQDIYVKIVDDIYVFVPYQGGVENGGYFQVIFEGSQIALYKKHIKDFKPEKKATSSITKTLPAVFKDKPVFYLVTKSGKFYQMPKSRSKKLKVFGEKQNQMKAFTKQNNLDLNKQEDLLTAVKYYDSL
ncbi:MAG: hypothetical protein QMC45_01875 [Patiriisocius sp.]|jgi:hypothetical protein